MATANTTAAPKKPCNKPLGDNAMADLCSFIRITKENPAAFAVWGQFLNDERPAIDCAVTADNQPSLFLAKPLAAFLSREVTA